MAFWNRKPRPRAVEITDDNFNEIVGDSEKPVLLDFHATWCGPCKILGPVIDELAGDYEEKAIIGKIDVDKNPGLTNHFKVKSMPTMFVIHKGSVVQRFSGLVAKPNLAELLDHYIDVDADSAE